jgi:uncharacterized protein (DUF697 family)
LRALKPGVGPQAVWELVKELRGAAEEDRPLVVSGAKELAGVLRRELTKGGVAEAVEEQGRLEGAAALVHVIAGDVDADDERVLREASRKQVPAIAVVTGPAAAAPREIPYVLAEDVVEVSPGSGFPVDEIGRALARRLGDRATALAARLPAIRRAVCEQLIERYARRNALIGAAVFIPGADMPILTLNEVRLVLHIADAHGFEIDRERLPEVLAVIGGGLGLRSLARRAVGLVPLVGWAVKGGVAYTGTRALGEAAIRYFERRAPVTRVPGERARFPR